jgi:hypothetical protein
MASGASAGVGFDHSYEVTENLTSNQYYVMKRGANDGQALLADTAGGVVLGVLQDSGLDGSSNAEHAAIRNAGESLCKIGGTVSAGDPLQADTDGMAIVAASGDYVFARAEQDGVDGDVIRVTLTMEGTF